MAELSTLARPYAKAVFQLAQSANALPEWSKQLAAIAQVVELPTIRAAIRAPGVARSQLADVLNAALGTSLSAAGQSLVKLLAANGRLAVAGELAAQFERQRAEAEARIAVEITTAAPVSEAAQAKLSDAVARKLNRAVDIAWQVDERLITGARIKAGDLVIDGSASGELERLRAALAR